MNTRLLDDGSRVVSHRFSSRSFYCKHSVRAAVKRGVVWLGRHLWTRPIVSITACWKDSSSSFSSSSPTNSIPYHRLQRSMSELFAGAAPPPQCDRLEPSVYESCGLSVTYGEDTVLVKVGIVGDCQTGKTSLMENYVVGDKTSNDELEAGGVNSMDKLLDIHSAKIALSIWDLGGYRQLMAPAVCKDAAAILIVFDLTRRTTLHSVKQWFVTARQINKVAIPVLVGTKFDQFIKLPENLKSLIIKQARLYAQAMGAPLLFTSVPYNINVNKVFKIVLARIFDLPCNICNNLTPGEPLVEY